jgi:hypothetical protein
MYVLSCWVLTLSYSSEINAVLCPPRVSLSLKKKHRDMSSDGCAAHPVTYNSPLQIVMAIWRTFLKICWVGGGGGAGYDSCLARLKFMKNAAKSHYYGIFSGLTHPTRSLSKIVCRGQEGPKGSKGNLKPDFQAYT